MRNIFLAVLLTALFYTAWMWGNYPRAFMYVDTAFQKLERLLSNVQENIAAVLLHKPVTVAELRDAYTSQSKKIRILIVPGHEPHFGGTEFGRQKEREMNVELANYLSEFLRNNDRYETILARDNNSWNPIFAEYFKTQWDEIAAFHRDNKQESLHIVTAAKQQAVSPTTGAAPKRVTHNAAPQNVALRLYGINKWSNENAVDITIHMHFNDVPRKNTREPGRYSGFSIYVPESAYYNSATTKAVAEAVFRRLSKYNATSNLPNEDEGIVESPELIAIGAYNTTNSASLLIEYGYIYEPQFQNDEARRRTLKDFAFQTYLGLQDFFGSGNDVSFAYDTLMLPHNWRGEITASSATTADALALQTALLLDGVYPVAGKSKNDCPRSGKIGPCTLGALETFQRRNGIKGENGYIGEKTRALLNSKHSIGAN